LHYDQDEWFYSIEGEFIFEVGQEMIRLSLGDSLLASRKVPHVWAHIGDTQGRILIVFTPAGKMESFFSEVTKANAMPPQDPHCGALMVWSYLGRLYQSPRPAIESS